MLSRLWSYLNTSRHHHCSVWGLDCRRRRRSRSRRVEALETRALLSASPLASTTAVLPASGQTVQVRIELETISTETALFDLQTIPSDGSPASVVPLEIRDQTNRVLPALNSPSEEGPAQRDELQLTAGTFDARIASNSGVDGEVNVALGLRGDSDGDGTIGTSDTYAAIDALFSVGSGFGGRLRDRLEIASGHVPGTAAPDADGNGQISLTDLELVLENQGTTVSGASLTVLPLNTAPTLDSSGNPSFDNVSEQLGTNSGTTVAEILSGGASGDPITDPDADAVDGIAIIGAISGFGEWQIDTTGGTDFTPLGEVSASEAVLLDPTARIRLVPEGGFTGTINSAIRFVAWDQTIGASGDTGVSTEFNGADSAFSTDSETVSLTIDDVPLTFDATASGAIESQGTFVINTNQIDLSGTTTPLATIEIDSDGDGEFDDGQTVASNTGSFVVTVPLVHNELNRGANSLSVRATGAALGIQTTVQQDVHFAVGTVVRFDSSQGFYDVELLDADAPQTVANFLNYESRYESSIVHRSASNFVVQGGGFAFDGTSSPEIQPIATDAPVPNEFNSQNSNVRGTLSTAQRSGDINSFTSQWFVNVIDNTFLDSVPHTVFGHVIGSGMDVVDQINNLNTANFNGTFPETALTDVPVTGYSQFTVPLTGTVTMAQGSNIVTGNGTSFTTEIGSNLGEILVGGETFQVTQILSNNQLIVNKAHTTGAANRTAFVNAIPAQENLVIFNSIAPVTFPATT